MAYVDCEERLRQVRTFYLKKLLKPEISSERARIITDSYQATEKEPAIVRRAKALEKILSEMSIYIQPWELIAGNLGPAPVSAPIYPEGGVDFILDELDTYGTRPGDKFEVSDSVKQELREILPWWQGKTLKDRGLYLIPPEAIEQREAGVFGAENMLTCGTGHFLPNYRKILHWGFEASEQYAREMLETLSLTSAEEFERKLFYEACLIICEAIRNFASRYVTLALELADSETDTERQQELQSIADACNQVPMKPATTFVEALQSLWFTHLICYIDSNGYGVTLGRTARDLYPFYKNSLENGDMTRDQARSHLISFMFKCNDILKLYNNTAAKNYGGFPVGQPIQLGGLDPDGRDETNDLAELFLEAEERVHLYQPDIGILWTESMSADFLQKAVTLVPTSHKPKFFNYHVGGKMYLNAGIPAEEARTNWAFIGCVEFGVPGKSWTWADAAMFNLGKCFELALYNGFDRRTSRQLGIQTGDTAQFHSFSQLLDAFKQQVAHMLKLTVQGITALQIAHRDLWPEPYESMLVDGCIEQGRDVNSGGAQYYQSGVQFVGLATVADSLMAIEEFVFERHEIGMKELLGILQQNFEGREVLRQKLWHQTPKFGNDNDEADHFMAEMFSLCCDEIGQYRDIWGGIFTASFYSLTAHIGFGEFVGATPDGRRAYAPLSDANSPSQGAVKNSVTAVLHSEAKLPHHKAINGTLLNVKLNRDFLLKEDGLTHLASLIEAYFRLGGFHVQFNVVDVDTLRDAQKHPEKYPDFLIRVAAYVTNWHQLSKEVQDEIIARSELDSF
ncbi:MAG: formate C-acetyltransferase/glycerol dehydratase family glycyl radical enzyme [bacterium]|nr:formate C-acetyltransferase/glycerol dehydratase family glycyl radical enzyme [bacterium]